MSKRVVNPVKPLTRNQIDAAFRTFASYIVPESELNWTTPLDLVVAVVLSAQATDKAVNKATVDLWRVCRTTDDYIALGEDGLKDYIRTIGLYQSKAKAIIGLCRRIKENFNDEIPGTRESLQSLPGVGRKTANVILNVIFNEPTLAVDTHVFRIANRMGLASARTPEGVEKILVQKVPAEYMQHAHHYLILHGRYTCKARRPECGVCKVSCYCNYPNKTDAM